LDYQDYLSIDEALYRPSEVNLLQGDASKALRKLKWTPEISFDGLIKEMVESNIEWQRK
jgi:GDPmannose 4,6-dehydratase